MYLGEVPRYKAVQSSARFNHFRGISPVIFENFMAAHAWQAEGKWENIEALCAVVGDEMTPVHVVNNHEHFNPSIGNTEIVLMPWAEAVTEIFNPKAADTSRRYLKSGMKPQLLRDCTPLPHAIFGFTGDEASSSLAKVWIGSAGNVTPLHFDLCHAVIVQAVGAKEVVLFPPSASRSLYPFSCSSGAPRTSRVNLGALRAGCPEAHALFPLAGAAAGGLRCTLRAGEALYIPPFWWHEVAAVEGNVSVLLPFDLSQQEQRRAERPWTTPEWGVYH